MSHRTLTRAIEDAIDALPKDCKSGGAHEFRPWYDSPHVGVGPNPRIPIWKHKVQLMPQYRCIHCFQRVDRNGQTNGQ